MAGVVVAGLFAAMFVRLWYLQVLDAPSFKHAVSVTQIRTVYEQGPRGEIMDRNGAAIVNNTSSETITLDRVTATKRPDVVSRLALLIGKPKGYVYAQTLNPKYSPYRPVPIMTDVPSNMVLYLSEHQDEFPGVKVQLDTERSYPYGDTLANVLGYVGNVSSQDLATFKNQGYQQGDSIGKSGVERSYESVLRGKPGSTRLEVNASGQVTRALSTNPPQPGDNVQLSIDLGLQQAVETDLANQIMTLRGSTDPTNGNPIPATDGAAVVLDPRNGQVLAMASFPTYNPSDFVGGISQQKFAQYQAPGSGDPLQNKATQGFYTPGSTFKIVTATAALNSGLINTNTQIDDPGSFTLPNCTGGQCSFKDDDPAEAGSYNVQSAITASDDVFFYNLGYMFWTQSGHYGKTPIQDTAASYGLGQYSGIPLPGESKNSVDSPALRQVEYQANPKAFPAGPGWYAGDNVELAFGQGETTVTPLQLANAYATFANGGTRYQPQLAAAVDNQAGKAVHSVGPVAAGHVELPGSTRDPMLAGFEGVTTSGTAAGAFSGFPQDQLQVAGKTGTATVSTNGGEPVSLFVCFAPAASPRYTVAVVINKGGYGAQASAPVARQILEYLLQHPIGPLKAPTPAS